MKQTIEIEVPDGKKAVWKNGKVVFENKYPLPKNWKDYFAFHFPKTGKMPEIHYAWADTEVFFDCPPNSDYRSFLYTRNLLSSDKAIRQHFAFMQLHQLRDCYRQGWKPDWKDDNYKYCILWDKNNYAIVRFLCTSFFLSFQTKKIAEEFLKNFRDLIDQIRDLI